MSKIIDRIAYFEDQFDPYWALKRPLTDKEVKTVFSILDAHYKEIQKLLTHVDSKYLKSLISKTFSRIHLDLIDLKRQKFLAFMRPYSFLHKLGFGWASPDTYILNMPKSTISLIALRIAISEHSKKVKNKKKFEAEIKEIIYMLQTEADNIKLVNR